MNNNQFKVGGMREYSNIGSSCASYDVMMDAKNRLIRDMHKHEDEALRGAVCRYFGVSNPFDAAKRVSVIPMRNGARRYVEAGTMNNIIRFEAPAFHFDDGKVSVNLKYTTFDGIK